MRVAAFFDLDDTIIKGNSGLRGVTNYFLSGQTSFFYGFKIAFRYFNYYWLQSDPYRFFNNLYEFMKGQDYKRQQKRFAAFFDQNIKKRIYKEAVKKIEWHRKQGHFVAIVTNSLDLMIERIKDQVKVDQLIASSLEVRNGKITGKTKLVTFGKNKVKFIKKLAKQKNIDLKKSYAYSDNSSDIPLLRAVGNPIATNPQQRMKRCARKNKWKMLFFKETGV